MFKKNNNLNYCSSLFTFVGMKNIQVIAFDADDTLWVNEPYFQETENRFCQLLEDFSSREKISQELLETEKQNVGLYGYGVKSFMLSMLETSLKIARNEIDAQKIKQIIELGKEQLNRPVELLDGVEEVLSKLYGRYKLVLATKGDLLDQERKLKKSELESYFHHIEIMSDKKESDYQKLVKHLDCKPENFLMVGNSVKSDILPVLSLEGYTAYVPYHITWDYEKTEIPVGNTKFNELKNILEVYDLLNLS